MDLLKQNNFTFKKKFGQNFISDKNLLASIVTDAGVTLSDTVIEVGLGAGALTEELCKAAKSVVGFEIDLALQPVLSQRFEGARNLNIVYSDILKVSEEEINNLTGNKPYKLVANLPYYITTPIIFKFLTDNNCVSMTLMVQKEVADRLKAKPDTADYGAITAKINALCLVTVTRKVNRNLFTPAPNVDSAVVRLDKNPIIEPHETEPLFALITLAFHMRRKTLVNNLMASLSLPREKAVKLVTSLGFNETVRGEKLSIHDFIKLNRAYKEM